MGTDSRVLLRIAQTEDILSYSRLLDYLDAGGESVQVLNRAVRTRQNRQFLRAYFESKRRIARRRKLSDKA